MKLEEVFVLKPQVKKEGNEEKQQCSLGKFFGQGFAAKPMQPVKFEEQIEALKRKRGRPSKVTNAILEARSKGETLVVTTLENWNKTLEKHADTTGLKSKVGRPVGAASQTLQNTNAKLPGAKNMRVDESAATKVMMCEVMKQNMKNYSNPLEYKNAMEMLYSKPWRSLKKS